MQIIPGVYQLNGPYCAQTNNGYLIKTEQFTIMVDSGDADTDAFALVEANAARWGLSLDEVDYLLLTHAHYDHANHAARLQRMGAKLVGNQACADGLAAGDERTATYLIHRPFETCELDIVVEDGEILTLGGLRVECISLPGHDVSCMGYVFDYDGDKMLFCGDVIKVGYRAEEVMTGWEGSRSFSKADYLDSLRKLAFMDTDHLMPGHGSPILNESRRFCEWAYATAMETWPDCR